MDSIFERSDFQADDEAGLSALADNKLYEEALDFSKPRETAFEKAQTKARGFFGRNGGMGRRTSSRTAPDGQGRIAAAGFRKAREDGLNYHNEDDDIHGAVRRRLADTSDCVNIYCLGEIEEPLPPPLRQPPSRSHSICDAGRGSGLSNVTGNKPRKPIQRSFSLATHRSTASETESSGSFSSLGFPHLSNSSWSNLENTHPNIDEFESLDACRERKKLRARRHSVAAPPSSKALPETLSMNLPPDLHWLAPSDPSPSVNRIVDLKKATTEATMMTTTPNTTSSRRKRGPDGSPFNSDPGDDWVTYSGASSDFSGSRRSCIFSPTETIQRPFDDPMEHSTDDESITLIPSPDTSFEVEKETKTPLPSKTKHVVNTMASIEDLRFLVNELRKEAKSQKRFGNRTWKVAPPVNLWPRQRRAAFMSWAKDQLGFSVRSAGMSISFVQISEDRGSRILETLEDALNEYKVPEQEHRSSALESIFAAGTTIAPRSHLFESVKAMDVVPYVVSQQSILNYHSHHYFSEPKPDLTEDDLAARVSSLSVNETSEQKHDNRSVTLPAQESDHKNQSRFSLENLVCKKSRCSVDSQSHDINRHILVSSPRWPRRRPPRLSVGRSLGKVLIRNSLPANDTMGPHPIFMNCVAT